MRSVLALAVLLLATPTPASALEFEPVEFKPRGADPVAAERGRLEVPEDRGDPASRIITLEFVRFKATTDEPGPPIVYLAGGPGGSGISAARGSRFPLFMALREHADVIALDQRGTGASGSDELDCDTLFLQPFDEPLDPVRAAAAWSEATARCMEAMRDKGIAVHAYNTVESAADLEDLREALGADQLTLWGISYGSHLALATMKRHPAAVHRAILAGVEPLHHSYKLPSDQQALLEEIARHASEDPAVHAVVPDLLGSIERALSTLESEPQTVRVQDPGGMAYTIALGPFDLRFALSRMLRGPEQFAALPDVVARLDQGDWLELALSVVGLRMGEGLHAMPAAMDCASGAGQEWLDRIALEAEGTLLRDAINFPYPGLCAELGVPDLGDDFRAPFASDIPTLLISGTLDGRTPPANAEELLPGLTQAVHLVIEGAGHSDPLFLSSPCILDCMQAFLRGEELLTTRIGLPPVEFLAPRKVVELPAEELAKFVGHYEITDGDVREVMLGGGLLYTRRGGGRPVPIRPMSTTRFFYPGTATQLEFVRNDAGELAGMVLYPDGRGEGEPARLLSAP